jgi:RNA polymerase sigma-70 factor (ECF subfamily)
LAQIAMQAQGVADTLDRMDVPARDLADADADDIRHSLTGDGQAFERIVRRYQAEIALKLARFSRDPLVLEELVQETFVQAYFSLHRYRVEAPLIHWLHRIAVRAGYRRWQADRARRRTLALEGQSLAAKDTRPPADDTLERVMRRLPPRDRLVLTLLYLEERSVNETASLTGWSRTMVKVQAHRARARLRKLMENERHLA